jgi:hypothetical protein
MEGLTRGAAAIIAVAESDLGQVAHVTDSMSPMEPPMTILFIPEAA